MDDRRSSGSRPGHRSGTAADRRCAPRMTVAFAWLLSCFMCGGVQAQSAHTRRDKRLEIASTCLARADDACVVRALEGRAESAMEWRLLIETYRHLNDESRARAAMQEYIKRFPNAGRAHAYRRTLGIAGPAAARGPTPKAGTAHAAKDRDKTPLDAANECLARGDDLCLIRVLEGKAGTAAELGLLCEAYRATGDETHAREVMAVYVARFPDAPRSIVYRRRLELGSQ